MDQLVGVKARVFPHGTTPVCVTYIGVHMWYEDEVGVADNLYYHSVIEVCAYSPSDAIPLDVGILYFGHNKYKKEFQGT